MPVEILAAEEGAAFGAALLAGVGAGVWPSPERACDACVRVSAVVRPKSENVAHMNRQYQAYRKLYPALRQIGDDLNHLGGVVPSELTTAAHEDKV